MTKKTCQVVTSEELAGERCDSAAAKLFNEYSRSRLQSWIKSGHLTLNGQQVTQRHVVKAGDVLALAVVPELEVDAPAYALDLDVVYEDEQLLVINKPAGLVVHPGAGNRQGTLMNALLYRVPELKYIPRAGIVHRLDKDTTGLMVVAKSLQAHKNLVKQLQKRKVSREYLALVHGAMTGGGTVEAHIGRHPKNRIKMAVVQREDQGKEAITHYRIEQRFAAHTLVRCFLETGRTHQIRVHLAHLRYPLVGDALYGGRSRVPAGISAELQTVLREFPRQALHARRLELAHPETGAILEWSVGLPRDFQQLLDQLTQEQRRVQ